MPPRIRSGYNQRSGNLPVDLEVEGVITTPYHYNPSTGEWEAAQAAGTVFVPRILLDYGARLDGNPVYVGKATQATALSANTWKIQRFTYDGTNRVTDIQILTGVWNDRAILAWS